MALEKAKELIKLIMAISMKDNGKMTIDMEKGQKKSLIISNTKGKFDQ